MPTTQEFLLDLQDPFAHSPEKEALLWRLIYDHTPRHITITGDRRSGKTTIAIEALIREVQRLRSGVMDFFVNPNRVNLLYVTPSMQAANWAFSRFQQYSASVQDLQLTHGLGGWSSTHGLAAGGGSFPVQVQFGNQVPAGLSGVCLVVADEVQLSQAQVSHLSIPVANQHFRLLQVGSPEGAWIVPASTNHSLSLAVPGHAMNPNVYGDGNWEMQYDPYGWVVGVSSVRPRQTLRYLDFSGELPWTVV